MKLHETQSHFHQAGVNVWWEWFATTIIGLPKPSPSRLKTALTIKNATNQRPPAELGV
jgi:hypothetical protein